MPFRAKNLSPPVAIFGLPAWNAPRDSNSIGLTSELVSHFRVSRQGSESLLLDGETWRTSFYYDRRHGKRWSYGLELPYYRHSGGVLDDLVDGWHSAFGLPDGGRNLRPEDELLFSMSDSGGEFYRRVDSIGGVGDVQLNLGYSFGRRGGLIARAHLKLPTGDEDALTGSGSTDFALSLLHRRELAGERSKPAGYFAGIGMLRTGAADAIGFRQRDSTYFAVVGAGLRVLPRFGIKVQFDLHGAFFRSALDELGDPAVMGSFGGWWRAGETRLVEFAVAEDIEVGSAPDVTLHIGFRWIL